MSTKDILSVIGGIIAVVAAAFAVFFFFEHRYAKKEDIRPNLYADALVTAVDHAGVETRFETKVHLDVKSLVLICASAQASGEQSFPVLSVPSSAVRISIDNKPVAANKDYFTFSHMTYQLDHSASYFAVLDPGDFLIAAERVYEVINPKEGHLALKVQTVALRSAAK
jgi:hypothetical protein